MSKYEGHTKAPWAWMDMGGLRLVGQHGHRPIVLDASGFKSSRAHLRVREDSRDVMVPLYPEHPDAMLIKDAAEILAQRNELLRILKEFHAASLVFAGSEPEMPTHRENEAEFDRLDAKVATVIAEIEKEA